MSNILKVACGWRRKEHWHNDGFGPSTSSVTYSPESIFVKYQENEEGQRVVDSVSVSSSEGGFTKREVTEKLTDIPTAMHQTVARIVQKNEYSYGRSICSVILPNGEKAYA